MVIVFDDNQFENGFICEETRVQLNTWEIIELR